MTLRYLPGQKVIMTGSTEHYTTGMIGEIVALPDDGWDYHVKVWNGPVVGVKEDGIAVSGSLHAGGVINWKPGDPVPRIV